MRAVQLCRALLSSASEKPRSCGVALWASENDCSVFGDFDSIFPPPPPPLQSQGAKGWLDSG